MQKIYVLQCKNNKYYIGKTADVDRRFAEHFSGEYGSEWTKYYPPRAVIEVENMTSHYDEMKKTLEYMKKFGIDHVRGAQWSNIHLTSQQRDAIMAALNTNACFRCGQNGHFSNNCTNRSQLFRTPQIVQCFTCGKYGHYANTYNYNQRPTCCERCGSYSHVIDNCYATFDIDGNILDCADECYAKSDVNGRRLYK